MPLNKLENFIKNTEGRILYVNPNDLDATDSIDNYGNSLTKPFKTIQRALIEAARFSYIKGDNNDIVEKTTILLFPGEHVIDNRPGYAIKSVGTSPIAVSPGGTEFPAQTILSLSLSSNFDLTQEDNILYKFNSIYGGVVVPRGTSIVGLDLRKTKIRPKYVPNPTDTLVKKSAIFRITGACYFWQFSLFDADENGLVYTDHIDFSTNNRSRPTFSHHKLTCFEYCDGVNIPSGYGITDLDMYYSKLSNAFNDASFKDIDQKYPLKSLGFSKQRPEWEIVGAFATDPVNIASIISGDGSTPGPVVTVTTTSPHGLTSNTPIKIRGVNVDDYNISTKVQTVTNETTFTYILPLVRPELPAGSAAGLSGTSATVTIETDTVSGASPYIFNISLRSVWGMNGMHADGSKASGFRSMVVAQFTAVSLQKDDRAFVKYNQKNGTYDNIEIVKQTGSDLASGSSSTNAATVYHLDPKAIYRKGWQSVHIKVTNDSFIQIVSVFAIGFNKHFALESGGDGSITNSNSNFGQFSLSSDGFKKDSFDKDNKAFITSIITPRAVSSDETEVDWIALDVNKTKTVGISSHLYLFGFNNADDKPPVLTQGYRIGARKNDLLYFDTPAGETKSGSICMLDNIIGAGSSIALGNIISEKSYNASAPIVIDRKGLDDQTKLIIGSHKLKTGEKIRIFSGDGDLPENVAENKIYYAITSDKNATRTDLVTLDSTEIQIASSKTNAESSTPVPITIYNGTKLKVISRVSDKDAGEIGSPIQWDSLNSGWFVHSTTNNDIFKTIDNLGVAGLTVRTNVSYVKRFADARSLDEKTYKMRVVIPKELVNARDPVEGFVIQESNTTGARSNADFSITSITSSDYLFKRNQRFITSCTYDSGSGLITLISDLPHNLKVGEQIIVKNVTSTDNASGTINRGFNGTFEVATIFNDKTIGYGKTDVFGTVHSPETFTNNVNVRNVSLPRFERNDIKGNFYVYRSEVITPYIYNVQDGVYHVYVLNASNQIPVEFTDLKYGQNPVNLYPQLDNDNLNDNPESTITFAKRNPLGDVLTHDLKNSLTRETVDKVYNYFGISGIVTSVETSTSSGITTITFDREHGFDSLFTYSTLSGGSGHVNGTYSNVKLYNNTGLTEWDGATANVTVSGGVVTSAQIVSGGSGYTNGETLYFDTNRIGGTASPTSARIVTSSSGISTAVGNAVQLTGIGITESVINKILKVNSPKKISIAQTSGDSTPVQGQYLINLGKIPVTTSAETYSITGITTFTVPSVTPHGLVAGNRFRVLDTSNNNRGDYLVREILSPTSFTSKTSVNFPSTVGIVKHGLAANEATSDSFGENLGTRGSLFFANETLILDQDLVDQTSFAVKSGISTSTRFPLGSYIQIGNEIMRITSSTLGGTNTNEISVIRGSMGTLKENHTSGDLIRKINLLPIEFRRPSVLRASGHTFEYMGFGPGNYSTGLPQIQSITLSEREEFLSQSQETSCGTVVYTGMNNNGDVFSGNTKTSTSSGKITSYDIPKPTVTGQDPNRLSVVFDEVIIKERLLVEGGNSSTILSQFNGPVTFDKELKMYDTVIMNGFLKVNNNVQITDPDDSTDTLTGALVIAGGVGIGQSVNIGGDLDVIGITSISNTTDSQTTNNGALVVKGGVGIERNLNVGGNTTFIGTVGIGSVTESTSKDTGCLVLEGGLGVEKRINTGGGIRAAQNTYVGVGSAYLSSGSSPSGRYAHLSNNSWYNGTAWTFTGNYAGCLYQQDGNVHRWFNNDGVTYGGASMSLDANSNLNVTADIIAFASDERLKTNIKPLESALDKVMQLSGFTYNFNEVAGNLGFNTEETYVGVSAQQVQAVLPEAVKPAPVDPNYITVQYEKLVPLLIEAIKELKQELDELKAKM